MTPVVRGTLIGMGLHPVFIRRLIHVAGMVATVSLLSGVSAPKQPKGVGATCYEVLGVQCRDVTKEELVKTNDGLKIAGDKFVQVTLVAPERCSAPCPIQRNDLIKNCEGKVVNTVDDLDRILGALTKSKNVTMTVVRIGGTGSGSRTSQLVIKLKAQVATPPPEPKAKPVEKPDDETVSDSEPPADAAAEQREEPTKRTAQSSAPTSSWAEVIEAEVDPAVVTDPALRDAIKATGLPWRVRDKDTKIEMLLIPPGEFVMGKSRVDDEADNGAEPANEETPRGGRRELGRSNPTLPAGMPNMPTDPSGLKRRRGPGNVGGSSPELPAHEVKLTKAFYLGRYEVTQEQFAAIRKSNPSRFAKFEVPTVEALMEDGYTKSEAEKKVKSWVAPLPASDAKGNEWPVEQVSWDICAAFCKKAGLRLPTEAEWEYACRAGTRTPRYGELDEIAWWGQNCNSETQAVGTKQANALGLHDMIGNVWEWVNDWWASDYYSTSPSVNPQGPSSASGTSRVWRGGGCSDSSSDCRASYRNGRDPWSHHVVGFRVAKTVSDREPLADAAAEQREEPTKQTAQSSAPTLSWAEVIEAEVDPAVVTDPALRDAIKATGLPWRVRDKDTKIEMLLIPPGEFVMGQSVGNDKEAEEALKKEVRVPEFTPQGATSDELPAHEVKLTKAFYLGRYEVTQEQFAAIRKSNPSRFAKFEVPTVAALMGDGYTKSEAEKKVQSWVAPLPALDAKGNEWPVEQVSWDICAAFCKKAGFRLPTEAEWEYACRAGTRTHRYGELDAIAWWKTNSKDETHAVGTKLANALGLHDMIGNVFEWVNDWYGYYSADAQTNPQGPSSGGIRVLRGGGWYNSSYSNCRASPRYVILPRDSRKDFGFRVARTP